MPVFRRLRGRQEVTMDKLKREAKSAAKGGKGGSKTGSKGGKKKGSSGPEQKAKSAAKKLLK